MHAKINGIKLAYDDFGRGPAIVLIHDLPLCRKMWQPQIEPLIDAGYRVIVPDLRGFGESESGCKAFSLKLCSEDIISLLHYLGLGRAVMAGTGLANQIILEIQEQHAHRLAAAILLAPPTSSVGTVGKVDRRNLAKMIQAGCRLTAIDKLCRHFLPAQQSLLTQELAWDIQQWMESAETGSLTASLELSSCLNTSTEMAVPALALTGDRTGEESSLNRTLTKAVVESVAGAGRLINLEKSEIVNRHLVDFLDWLGSSRPRHHRLSLAA